MIRAAELCVSFQKLVKSSKQIWERLKNVFCEEIAQKCQKVLNAEKGELEDIGKMVKSRQKW